MREPGAVHVPPAAAVTVARVSRAPRALRTSRRPAPRSLPLILLLAWLACLALLGGARPAAAAAPPELDAAAWVLVDGATGETLASREPDRELPMASTTKVMTALVVLERARLDALATVPAEAAIGGTSAQLVTGERVRVGDLLTGLLVASGNDAAVTLAVHVGGSQESFVALMNRTARRLGLRHTAYANPHGLDAPGHHTSVRDLVSLARVAMRRPVFRRTVARRTATIPGPGGVGTRTLESRNSLLELDPSVDGIKTGNTDGAGYAIVTHARRDGVDLYAALIGATNEDGRALAAEELLDWGFAQYARPELLRPGRVVAEAPVHDRPGVRVPLVLAGGLRAPVRLGRGLTETAILPPELRGPVTEGVVVGRVVIRQGSREIGSRPVVAGASAGEPGLLDRVRAGWRGLVS